MEAKRLLPPELARETVKTALASIIGGLPSTKIIRRRLQAEAATRATYVVCRSRLVTLSKDVRADDATILAVECALRMRLASGLRTAVCAFLVSNMAGEYERLCRIKSKGYDAFSKPIFWPRLDRSPDDADTGEHELSPDPAMLREIHGSVVAGQQKHAQELRRGFQRAARIAEHIRYSARARCSRRCAALLGRMVAIRQVEHPLALCEREMYR